MNEPADRMRVLIFANPYSGRRDNRVWVERFEQALADRGLSPAVVWEGDGRADVLRDVCGGDTSGGRAVVAAGGDGSVNDVVNDMETAGCLDVPFATLPVGTENLFAKELGFRLENLDAIADAIARGDTRPIDLARIEHGGAPPRPARLFTLMASAGFDAEVVRRLDVWRTAAGDGKLQRVRRLSYLRPVLAAVFGYRYPAIKLTADGQTVTGTQAYAFNLPQYGGELGIGRHACPDDGRLHWLVFQKPGILRLLLYHWRCKLDRQLDCQTIAHGYAQRVTIEPAPASNDTPAPAQADGDPAGDARLQLEILPGALKVIRVDHATP